MIPLCVLMRRGEAEAHVINLAHVEDSVGFAHEALAFSIKVTTLGLMLFVVVSKCSTSARRRWEAESTNDR